MIEMISLNEMMTLFRSYGLTCSYKPLVALIKAGKFPFAMCAEDTEGKNVFYIFKKDCLLWLEARMRGEKI